MRLARPYDRRPIPGADDRLRKRVPRRRSAIAQVPGSIGTGNHQQEHGTSQVIREGRTSYLIIGHSDGLSLAGVRE
jgi:hypothetical protein